MSKLCPIPKYFANNISLKKPSPRPNTLRRVININAPAIVEVNFLLTNSSLFIDTSNTKHLKRGKILNEPL